MKRHPYQLNISLMVLYFISLVAGQNYSQQGSKLVGSGFVGPSTQGFSNAISGDGKFIVFGGCYITPYCDNNGVGAAWVFSQTNGIWSQVGNKLVGSGYVGVTPYQGFSVSISFDSKTIALSGVGDNSFTGAVWTFTRSNTNVFEQQGNKFMSGNTVGPARQGHNIMISSESSTIVVGAPWDNSNIGAVFIFTQSSGIWGDAGLKLIGDGYIGGPNMGRSVVISFCKSMIVFGGPGDNNGIGAVWVFTLNGNIWSQQGSKLVGSSAIGQSNQGTGFELSLSVDLSTIAVGGIGDNSNIGAVWIFTLSRGVWSQQGNKLVGSDFIGQSYQGFLTLSSDGSVLFVGGFMDSYGNGSIWQYSRTNNIWVQVNNKFLGSGTIGNSQQGHSLSFSNDGSTLIFGGYADNNFTGAVWVYTHTSQLSSCKRPYDIPSTIYSLGCPSSIIDGTSCIPSCNAQNNYFLLGGNLTITCTNGTLSIPTGVCGAYLQEGSKLVSSDFNGMSAQGSSTAISGGGQTVVLGGCAYWIGSAYCDNNGIGAVWVFSFLNGTWGQVGSKLVGTGYEGSYPYQGSFVSLSFDGKTIASSGFGDNFGTGAVWIFTYSNSYYQQQGHKLVASNSIGAAQQGHAIMLSTDGTTLVVGAPNDDSLIGTVFIFTYSSNVWVQTKERLVGTGYVGNACMGSSVLISYLKKLILVGGSSDNMNVGAVWVFTLNGNGWYQQGPKLIGSNSIGSTRQGDIFRLTLSANASTFAVGGPNDNSLIGAVWIFTLLNGVWNQQGNKLIGSSFVSPTQQGSVCLSADGNLLFVAGPIDASSSGAIWQFTRINGNWSQIGNKFLGTDTNGASAQGVSITLSNDANTLIWGGYADNSYIGGLWVYTISSPSFSCQRPYDTPSTFYSIYCPSPLLDGDSCTPTCNENYVLNGDSLTITCNNGSLSLPAGICIGLPCKVPNDTSTTIYSNTCSPITASGDLCEPTCTTFASNDISILCTAGMWSFPLGVCAPIIKSISTIVSSTPLLVASSGTELFTLFEGGDPLQYYSIAVNGVYAVNHIMPYFNTNLSGSVFSINVNVTFPTYYNLVTVALDTSNFNITFLSSPLVLSVCPSSIPAQANATVIVQGKGFISSPSLRCILNNTLYFVPMFSQHDSVTCVVYWPINITDSIDVSFTIANDGLAGSPTTVNITISGTCNTELPGSVSSLLGCVCPIGTFDTGSSCQQCGDGQYQNQQGQTACKLCGSNQNTNYKTGSTSANSCVCSAAYFIDPKTKKCLPCVPGMLCPGNNIIGIYPGYWRASNRTADVVACPGSTISCKGSTNTSSSLCANGYTGPECLVCEKGYAKRGYLCIQCVNSNINGFALTVLIVFAIIFAYFLIKSATVQDNENFQSSAEKATKEREGSLQVLIKVTLNYLQVLYYIGRLSSNWSDLSRGFFEAVGIVGALSPQTYTIQCATNWRFYDTLVFIYISPAIIVTILTVVYFIIHIVKQQKFKDTKTNLQLAMMLLLYEIHPTILLNVISSFPCDAVPGTDTSYLKADYSIDCQSREYKVYATISAIYLVLYVFGMLVAVILKLQHNHSSGKLHNPSHNAYFKYRFFFMGFRPNTYYWEAMIMLRKMGIVAFSVLASPMLQLVFGNVILMISFSLNITQIPFASHFVNRLESLSLITLLATISLGFLFLNAQTTHHSDTLWISILLILINATMMAILVFYSFQYLRQYARKLEALLPKQWRSDEESDVVMTENPRLSKTSRKTKNMEMGVI